MLLEGSSPQPTTAKLNSPKRSGNDLIASHAVRGAGRANGQSGRVSRYPDWRKPCHIFANWRGFVTPPFGDYVRTSRSSKKSPRRIASKVLKPLRRFTT